MSRSFAFFSPAKVNLFFSVLSRREDGYHEIASLFQTISLGDSLEISPASSDSFFCNWKELENENNLAIKALLLFRKKTKILSKVSLRLFKKIPLQAGLGGGSSNAATTLFALNELFARPVAEKELLACGEELGADVPFFFSRGSAFCTGKGEKVKEVTLPFSLKAEIIKPSFGLSTEMVFRALSLDSLEKKDPKEVVKSFLQGNPYYFNDLEKTSFQQKPELKRLKNFLKKKGKGSVVMTGSGSALVCVGGPSLEPEEIKSLKVDCYKVVSIQRKTGNWYTFHHPFLER